MLAFAALLVACGLFYLLMIARFSQREQRLLWIAYVAQVAACVAHVLITMRFYGGSGDLFSYHMAGGWYADVVNRDPHYFGDLVRSFLQLEHDFPEPIRLDGGTTGSMYALSGLLQVVLGPSIYALCLVAALVSLAGQLAIYRVLREYVSEDLRERVLWAAMLIPSVLYWSGGYMKESFALAGLGFGFLGLHHLIVGTRLWRALPWLLLGFFLMTYSKPYVMVPLFMAGGFWFYVYRVRRTQGYAHLLTQPLYLAGLASCMVVALYVLGQIFPRYSIAAFAEVAAQHQHYYSTRDHASSFIFGDPEERSFAGQMAFAPLALVTALFRPLIFEVHNATMLLAALETTVIIVLMIGMVRRTGIKRLYIDVLRNPIITFCLVYTVMFAIAVGLTTQNFGTLSRYRIPMMPFYMTLVLVMSARSRVLVERDDDELSEAHDTGIMRQNAGSWRPRRVREGGARPRRIVHRRIRAGRVIEK